MEYICFESSGHMATQKVDEHWWFREPGNRTIVLARPVWGIGSTASIFRSTGTSRSKLVWYGVIMRLWPSAAMQTVSHVYTNIEWLASSATYHWNWKLTLHTLV